MLAPTALQGGVGGHALRLKRREDARYPVLPGENCVSGGCGFKSYARSLCRSAFSPEKSVKSVASDLRVMPVGLPQCLFPGERCKVDSIGFQSYDHSVAAVPFPRKNSHPWGADEPWLDSRRLESSH